MSRISTGVLRRIWRGACRPLWPLPSNPKWYHYADYWARRPNDFIIAALIPLIPLAMGFLLHRDGSIHPYLLIVHASVWTGALLLAYLKGGGARDDNIVSLGDQRPPPREP